MHFHTLIALPLLLLAACGSKDTGAPVDSGPPETPQLTEAHPGWKDPLCLDCHTTDDHNTGLVPYECVACHDVNGAPPGHGQTDGCDSCHGTPHGSDGFPVPDSCVVCHP